MTRSVKNYLKITNFLLWNGPFSDDDEEDDGGDNEKIDDSETKRKLTCSELISMLDRIQLSSLIDTDDQEMLSIITKKVEDIQIKSRTQTTIADFFTC